MVTTTLRLRADAQDIQRAAAILRAGGLVAFPTETVYGLGANALDAQAVRGIFEAKGRPADDPLIVHVASVDQLHRIARANAAATALAQAFWPGPLTLVLPKQPDVPPEVTAGLDTVAVRIPSHPVAQSLLRATHLPLAAPSANLFSRPSPTRAQHVLDDLDGRIQAVIDGGAADVGVESTIVDLTCDPPRLLRPGGLPAEAIATVLGVTLAAPPAASKGPQLAPGLLPVHYAPHTPLVFVVGPPERARACLRAEVDQALAAGQRVGVLALDDDEFSETHTQAQAQRVQVERLGSYDAALHTAARLFDALRALDRAGLDILFARELADPSLGLGRALSDRLRRAAQRVVVPQ